MFLNKEHRSTVTSTPGLPVLLLLSRLQQGALRGDTESGLPDPGEGRERSAHRLGDAGPEAPGGGFAGSERPARAGQPRVSGWPVTQVQRRGQGEPSNQNDRGGSRRTIRDFWVVPGELASQGHGPGALSNQGHQRRVSENCPIRDPGRGRSPSTVQSGAGAGALVAAWTWLWAGPGAPAPLARAAPGVRCVPLSPARPAGRTPGSLEQGREMVSARGPGRDPEGLVPTGRNRLPAAAGPGVPAPRGGVPIRVSSLDRGLGDSQSRDGSSPRTASGGGGRARSVGTFRAPWVRGPLAGPRPQVTPTRFSLPEPESERTLVLQGEEKRLPPPGSPSRGLVRPPAHIARGARAPFVRGAPRGPRAVGRPRETLESHARVRRLEKLHSLSGASVF